MYGYLLRNLCLSPCSVSTKLECCGDDIVSAPSDPGLGRVFQGACGLGGSRSPFLFLLHFAQELEEESIRDNFVIIYELMDEMMDFGYPQTTESKILQECAW